MKEKLNAEFQKYWPQIKAKIGTVSADTSDEDLERLVLSAHKNLPMSARIIIRKNWLVSFCLENKNKLATLNE